MPGQRLHFPSDRQTIRNSILKSRLDLWRLQCDLHDTVLMTHGTISRSRELIARADKVLTRFSLSAPYPV